LIKNKIKEFRLKKIITQQDLATNLKITRQTIIALEKNRYNPSLELSLKIAQFFDATVEDVFWLE